MKIRELLEGLVEPLDVIDRPLDTDYDLKALKQARDDYAKQQSQKNEPIGGWYSGGRPGKDPHEYEVETWLPSRVNVDAKLHWIKAIKPYMGDNPYMPVYYSVRLKPDRSGRPRVESTMERLISMRELGSIEGAIPALAAKTFGNDDYYQREDMRVEDFMRMLNNTYHDYERVLSGSTSSSSNVREDYLDSVDPELLEAFAIISKLDRDYNFDVDMHDENVMVRNTSRGYQLVITDPLSDEGRSIIHPG